MKRGGSLSALFTPKPGHFSTLFSTRRAHRHQAVSRRAPFQFVEYCSNQDCARCTDRVAERDRSAIDIHLGAIEPEVADEFFGDDCECFVDFPKIDIVLAEACLGQHFSGCRLGGVDHQCGIIADNRGPTTCARGFRPCASA